LSHNIAGDLAWLSGNALCQIYQVAVCQYWLVSWLLG